MEFRVNGQVSDLHCGHAIEHCTITNKYRQCSNKPKRLWGNRGTVETLEAVQLLTRAFPPNNPFHAAPIGESLVDQFGPTPICTWHAMMNPKFRRSWIKLIPYYYLAQLYNQADDYAAFT